MLGAKVYYGLRSEKEVAFKSHLEQRHENHSKQELAFFVQNLIKNILIKLANGAPGHSTTLFEFVRIWVKSGNEKVIPWTE